MVLLGHALRTGLLQLVRSRIQGSYVLCEVRPQRAEMLRKTINLSKKPRPRPQNSSGIHRPLVLVGYAGASVCAARKANPLRGGGAKPTGLLARR